MKDWTVSFGSVSIPCPPEQAAMYLQAQQTILRMILDAISTSGEKLEVHNKEQSDDSESC